MSGARFQTNPIVAAEPERLAVRLRRLEDAVRRSERDRRGAVARLLEAERLERRRIAGELHDDTVQVLTAALLSLDRIERLLDPGQAHDLVADVRAMLTSATDRTRRLSFELRPPRLAGEGLDAAVADLAAQASQEGGFEVQSDLALGSERYDFVVEEVVYRTLQELISNIRKHAEAACVRIVLGERDGELHGLVSDDGRGFSVERALDTARTRLHMGLAAVEERLELAGGSLHVRSQPGRGTTIDFRLPTGRDTGRG